MTWNKHKKQLELALASSMRLLVLIRESLKREPGGMKTPLFEAVAAQANLCGVLLPDSLRMSQAEVDYLVKQLGAVPKERTSADSTISEALKARIKEQGVQVLVSDGKGGFGV